MNEELSGDKQQEWARQLFTREGETIRDIALKVGVPEAAVRDWVNKGAWYEQKRSFLISREKQLEQLYGLLEKLTEKMSVADDVNPKDAELAAKYTAAIKNLDTEVSVPQVIEVAKLFTSWLRRKDLDQAKMVTLEFDAFIKHRLKPQAES